jgi:hypothetical protein
MMEREVALLQGEITALTVMLRGEELLEDDRGSGAAVN